MIKTMSIEAHHSIDIIKTFHGSLRRIYIIIITEILEIELELILQMTFKIINDSADFNELVFTLLMFDVYSQMTNINASLFIVIQKIITMKKAMKEVQKSVAFRQFNDVLNIQSNS